MKRHLTHARILLVFLLSSASYACSGPSEGVPALRPLDVSQFIAPAGEPVRLQFSVDAGMCAPEISFVVKDYAGAEESRGAVHCEASNSALVLPLTLGRGYHEIAFPEQNATFGVVAVDRLGEAKSTFFGVDAAFSYLEQSPAGRSQFIGQLSRLGIMSVRDRISWSELDPEKGQWSGSGHHQFNALRQLYAKAGIAVIDVLQGFPSSSTTYFPLSDADDATVSQMATRWGHAWGGVEVSNEPDHNRLYDNLPNRERGLYQSQYAGYASRVSKAVRKAGASAPIVGGAFAFALSGGKPDSSPFANGVAAAGLLRSVDAISFHTYVDPQTLQRDIDGFNSWLGRNGRADMPLWITESGWSWKQGPARPPMDQDQLTALQIAGKAVVAYGMGVSRYFAFVYPYYEENGKNFGMSGRERTPLRSLASYAQVAKTLSGAHSLTTIRTLPAGGLGALFETPGGAVMVVYQEKSLGNQSAFVVPFEVLNAEGIDGRPLASAGGKLSLSDGLIYIWLAKADVPKAEKMLGVSK